MIFVDLCRRYIQIHWGLPKKNLLHSGQKIDSLKMKGTLLLMEEIRLTS